MITIEFYCFIWRFALIFDRINYGPVNYLRPYFRVIRYIAVGTSMQKIRIFFLFFSINFKNVQITGHKQKIYKKLKNIQQDSAPYFYVKNF